MNKFFNWLSGLFPPEPQMYHFRSRWHESYPDSVNFVESLPISKKIFDGAKAHIVEWAIRPREMLPILRKEVDYGDLGRCGMCAHAERYAFAHQPNGDHIELHSDGRGLEAIATADYLVILAYSVLDFRFAWNMEYDERQMRGIAFVIPPAERTFSDLLEEAQGSMSSKSRQRLHGQVALLFG